MPSNIRVLDEHTINKIAAGEVIENPSSVIKELVENALDAGSTEISVEIKGGGRQLMRVVDNGCGMGSDDALLCLERHATSKIKAVEDIQDLLTMGFRGEAVPSIAAISKFTILTRQKECAEGTMVLVEGGSILKCCPVACSTGTTMEVKSLFFNVPVRKKFQKSPVHDINEILKIMTLLSLGYPEIKFRLISDGETLLSAPRPLGASFHDKLKERIGTVLGGDFAENGLKLEGKKDDFSVRGWIGSPLQHRQNRTGQFLFINQRGIQAPLVSFAIKDGYGTTMPAQRHPVYVLHITLPGNFVDVNVHPQKKEVRFRQEHALREMLIEAVRESLRQTECELPVAEPASAGAWPLFLPSLPGVPTIRPVFMPLEASRQERPDPMPELPAYSPPTYSPPAYTPSELPFTMPQPKKTVPRVMGTIPRYLILENPPQEAPHLKRGLCLVDQCAAHTRIIYERLKMQREAKEIAVQTLLIPETIELSSLDAHCVTRHLPLLQSLGIHLHECGKNTFLLETIPEAMGNIDPNILMQEIIAHLHEENTLSFREQIDKKMALSAVRASISKEKSLSIGEGQSLLQQLLACEIPWFCPQGKPTLIIISSEEIGRLFS